MAKENGWGVVDNRESAMADLESIKNTYLPAREALKVLTEIENDRSDDIYCPVDPIETPGTESWVDALRTDNLGEATARALNF